MSAARIRAFRAALEDGLRPTTEAVLALVEPAVVLAGQSGAEREFESALEAFDAACRAGLTAERELIHGIGYMAEPGAIEGSTYWARWWSRASYGKIRLGEHALDPADDAFYDYPQTEWFTDLRQGAERATFGPYVDVNGTNDYTVTISRAVWADGAFLGAVGVDIAVSALERRFEPPIRDLGTPALLVNAENRVVVSTHAEWAVGSRLTASGQGPQETHRLEPWTLLVFGT